MPTTNCGQPDRVFKSAFSSRKWETAGVFLVLLIPLTSLLPALFSFPYPASTEPIFSDLTLTHYPNAIFLRNAILQYHVLPLWSPNILSGHPFAANPLAGIWYPPGWLALFLPLPFGFNLLILLHLLWGGYGMLSFLRQQGLSLQAALLGGLAFTAMPKLFAHYGAGHLTLLYAIPWTPWLLWASEPAMKTGKKYLPAVILALIFTADPRWALYAALLWWAYRLFILTSGGWRAHLRTALIQTGQSTLAALLAAPLAIPMLEFARLSSRDAMTVSDVLTLSFPPSRLIGLVFPDFGGFHEWTVYPGVIIFLMAYLLMFQAPRQTRAGLWRKVPGYLWLDRKLGVKFWVLVFVATLLFSLGENFSPMAYLAKLPFFNLLRVPSRALFLMSASLGILAAYALDDLLVIFKAGVGPKALRNANLALLALFLFVLSLTGFVIVLSGTWPVNFIWGCVMVGLGVLWILLGFRSKVAGRKWFAGLLVLCLLDWAVVNTSLFISRSAEQVLAERQEQAAYLLEQPGQFRVYSPSYSLPQQTAALAGLALADGVDPLQLKAYVAFMHTATGIPFDGYSVTMPPFQSGQPSIDNINAWPEPNLLGLLNVKYVLSEYDLFSDCLDLSAQLDGVRIYQNLQVLPRAWVQPAGVPPGENYRPVIVETTTPNRISLQAEGPGRLVLSELAYPGWRVHVDGERAEIQTVMGLLRAVEIPAGQHEVVFLFRPLSVYAGLACFCCGILFILIPVTWRFAKTAT